MKNLNIIQMAALEGGICVPTPGNGQNDNCTPCPAFIAIAAGGLGDFASQFGGPFICIA